MADGENQQENAKPEKPEPASQEALHAAGEIAAWCDKRKEEALADAKLQMRLVWFLLAGGIALLLILPRLVAEIDFLDAELPPEEVQRTAEALRQMENKEEEMKIALDDVERQLSDQQEGLLTAGEEYEKALQEFEAPFDDPLAVWRQTGPQAIDFEMRAFAQHKSGELVAAGYERTYLGDRTLIMRSLDGNQWTLVRPVNESGERISGLLYGLAFAPENGWLAAGYERTDVGNRMLVMRSLDGNQWTPVRPVNESGERISGPLYDLASDPEGGWLAAGFEETDLTESTLIMRSPDGIQWTPVRPVDESGERIPGFLFGLASDPESGWLAVGREETDVGRRTLIIQSSDGNQWTTVRPTDEAGERISGELYGLAFAPENGWLAAGYERTDVGNRMLVMRSLDGNQWTPVRPVNESGERISGPLFDVVPDLEGGWLAAGREETDVGNRTLIMRSLDGDEWIPVRLENYSGNRERNQYFALFVASDGMLFADGQNAMMVRWTPASTDAAQEALITGEIADDILVPYGSAMHAASVRQKAQAEENALELLEQQERFRNQAADSYQRQAVAVEQITNANKNLEDALRRAEPVRQASWIATRLGVIALLIFLVQIVVNRYRYLQRLADFYDGRGQAFRMLAASGETAGGSLLNQVSLNELMAGLSPGAISFGREAEPPTQHLMSILQTAIKK